MKFWLAAVTFIFIACAHAETLPAFPRANDEQRVFITKQNVTAYNELLLAPIATWIKNSQLYLRVVRDLEYSWKEPNSELSADKNPDTLAQKILWGMLRLDNRTSHILYDLEIAGVSPQALLRVATGHYYRSYNSEEDPVLRRDVLRLLTPPITAGYAQISSRNKDLFEDNVWIFSPASGHLRQVVSTNRGDPIVGSNLSFDDLFVFSEKIQGVNAKVVENKTLLVFFPSTQGSALHAQVQTEQTIHPALKNANGDAVAALWNFEQQQILQVAPWSPTSAVAIPRKVWILEINPRDPFSAVGKQVLVVDEQTLLPVYKVVYDRRGKYWKTVVGAWSLATNNATKSSVPYLGFILAVENSGIATTLTTRAVTIFPNTNSEKAQSYEALLDPKSYQKTKDTAPKEEGVIEETQDTDADAELPPAAEPTTPLD